MSVVDWKNTKDYEELRRQMRLEIIKEIQETAGCRKCKKFMRVTEKDLREKPR